jgi:Arc/MetJ-type ribon-helix-helix transcriptional regulator
MRAEELAIVVERGDVYMKTIEVDLPERLTAELDVLLKDGWFADESEIMRTSLWEFVRRNRFALTEQFQRADIVWALQQHRERRASASAQP